MKVQTSRFGEIVLAEEDRLKVVGGLLGFYGLCDYGEYRPEGLGIFRWLQSLEIPRLAFVMCPAAAIVPDYGISVAAQELSCIGLTSAEDADVYVILTHPEEPSQMTANLLGPIIVNRATRMARQVVLYDTEYSSRHIVFPHLNAGVAVEGGNVDERRQECA